jgi:hypothetical protein
MRQGTSFQILFYFKIPFKNTCQKDQSAQPTDTKSPNPITKYYNPYQDGNKEPLSTKH